MAMNGKLIFRQTCFFWIAHVQCKGKKACIHPYLDAILGTSEKSISAVHHVVHHTPSKATLQLEEGF